MTRADKMLLANRCIVVGLSMMMVGGLMALTASVLYSKKEVSI